eukprot:551148-Rhodomonas_salina.1
MHLLSGFRGTEIGYHAMGRLVLRDGTAVREVCGTETGYGGTVGARVSWYAVRVTEIAYGAMAGFERFELDVIALEPAPQ